MVSAGRSSGLPDFADPGLPLRRAGLVHRGAVGIDGHGHRHVLHVELVDRLHAEVGEADDAATALIALDTR